MCKFPEMFEAEAVEGGDSSLLPSIFLGALVCSAACSDVIMKEVITDRGRTYYFTPTHHV